MFVRIVVAGLALGVMAGCATSRGEMALTVPAASVSKSDGPSVYIDEIVDSRVFEDKPAQPSTPSLKGGNGASESESIKAKAVARKRNGYGMALGDILLEGDQTVVGVTRDLVRESFEAAGYRVVADRAELGNGGMEVDIDIAKFWAWFTPGFWSVSMESQIETELAITQDGKSREVTISAYGRNNGQSGRESNWLEAYRRGFEDYKAKFETAF